MKSIGYSAIVMAVVDSGVIVTQHGKKGLAYCPFHKEQTPSFSIDPKTETFYCFGCHATGDVTEYRRRAAARN